MTEARQFVEGYAMEDGRTLYLLAEGRSSTLSAAEGHPASVMDMSFANQALSAEYAIQNAGTLERKVYVVPEEIDKEIARLKLETMGIDIDTLTEEQAKYLASWDEGTVRRGSCPRSQNLRRRHEGARLPRAFAV